MLVISKLWIQLVVVASFLILLYGLITSEFAGKWRAVLYSNRSLPLNMPDNKQRETKARNARFGIATLSDKSVNEPKYINIWCIFTKIQTNYQMKSKFKTFLVSLLEHTYVKVVLWVITDTSSKSTAVDVIRNVQNVMGKNITVSFYDVNDVTAQVSDIVTAMKPYFSSQPGSYYSDALFFLSLGLFRIAKEQDRAIMLDIDVKFLANVEELFREFDSFGTETLIGMAPELTPVYHHILYSYRGKHKHTPFGNPTSEGGFPGVNSGVVLLHLKRMRMSEEYHNLLQSPSVSQLASKYNFKGHLGDQDFVTLLAWERPELVRVLPCNWNRQLCTWWRDHGYRDVFDQFFQCQGPVYLYHGNCNTPIPA